MTVRVGVVGAGAMGADHVTTLSRWVSAAQVSTVFDADPARADAVSAGVGATTAASAETVVASPDVDAVLVATPDPFHEELALACVAAGKPVLVEKPLTTTPEGARRVVDAEVAAGLRLVQVGFMRRYDAAYRMLRTAAHDGSIGELRSMHCLHRNAAAHPDMGTDGVLVNAMIHEFDCVPWLLDDPLAAVTLFAARVPDGAMADVQIAVLETVAGRVATVEASMNARYGYDIHTEITGTEGTVSLTPPYGVSYRQASRDGRFVDADFVGRFGDAYRVELASWLDDVEAGTLTGPSAWDGYTANVTAFAAVESLHGGGRVEIDRAPVPELYR